MNPLTVPVSRGAVIFDFGGVLVRTCDQGSRADWERRLGLLPGQAEEIVFGGEHGRAAQLGIVSDEAHWLWIQARLHLTGRDLHQFRLDFFKCDRLDDDLISYIRRLRSRYCVGLLSNASSDARRVFSEVYPILGEFDAVTISAEEGIMKPDPGIYRIALRRLAVAAREAVFVDDSPPNIEGAKRLGMRTVLYSDPFTARQQLVTLTGIL